MAGNAIKLAHNHPDIFNPFGDLEPDEFFDREGISQILTHGGEVIHAVGIRDDTRVIHGFRMLLETAMHIAQMRSHLLDDFTIRHQGQSKDTMSAGMLGTHAEDHLIAFPLDILRHEIPLWWCCWHFLTRFRLSPREP